jgi:deoxyribonuclease IV
LPNQRRLPAAAECSTLAVLGVHSGMFGSHLSIAGSLCNALHEARALGMDTVQIFTKNQQQWAAKPLDPAVIAQWRTEVEQLGWQARTVSHASYLINLASPNDELWRKSIDLMTDEISRCEALGVPFLVHHPGAFTSSSEAAGIARIARAYRELFDRTPGFRTVMCLETTVGSGSNLGGTFEQMRGIRDAILADAVDAAIAAPRVAYCLDTCHIHAAGYDISSRAKADDVLAKWDSICGLSLVRALHINDSKAPCGSRRDLHANIGAGTITSGPGGLAGSGFAAVVNLAAWRDVPKILETPKGADAASDSAEGETANDLANLKRLWSLVEWRSPPPLPDKVAPITQPSRGVGKKPKPRGVKAGTTTSSKTGSGKVSATAAKNAANTVQKKGIRSASSKPVPTANSQAAAAKVPKGTMSKKKKGATRSEPTSYKPTGPRPSARKKADTRR